MTFDGSTSSILHCHANMDVQWSCFSQVNMVYFLSTSNPTQSSLKEPRSLLSQDPFALPGRCSPCASIRPGVLQSNPQSNRHTSAGHTRVPGIHLWNLPVSGSLQVADVNTTCAPDPSSSHPEALSSLLIVLGHCVLLPQDTHKDVSCCR